MQEIPITKITIPYKSVQNAITAEQFRGAFIDYIRTHFSQQQQEKLPMHLAYNKDRNGKQLNRYSVIQYKTYSNKLEIVAIGESQKISALWLTMVCSKQNFTINGKQITLEIPVKNTFYWYPAITQKQYLFKIQNWKPFNAKTIGNKNDFDKIIWGNIHRMLTDLNIQFSKKTIIHILENKQRPKTVKAFGIKWISFDIIFSTNINLPQYIGIGHIVSLGSGKIIKTTIL